MIEINLLPKEYRKGSASFSLGKTGMYVLGGVAGVAVILIGITLYQMHQLSQLETNIGKANDRASMLRTDIRVVDALLDVKSKIHHRIRAVDQLDRHRSVWVRILEDVARNVPEFVWLASFKEVLPDNPAVSDTSAGSAMAAVEAASTRPVEIEGYTFTLNGLAAFMIKTMRSDYFNEVELVSSEDKVFEAGKAYNFLLTANVHYLSEEELRNLIAQTGGESGSKTTHKSLN